MKSYTITAKANPQLFRDVQFKDGAETYSFDLSPWAEDNANITSVAWTVKSGQVGISGQALSSNVASALLTFTEAGRNLIQIKATDGTRTFVITLEILAKDMLLNADDYGICV